MLLNSYYNMITILLFLFFKKDNNEKENSVICSEKNKKDEKLILQDSHIINTVFDENETLIQAKIDDFQDCKSTLAIISNQTVSDKSETNNQSTEMNNQYEINSFQQDYSKINASNQTKSMMLNSQNKLSKINEATQFDVIGKVILCVLKSVPGSKC